MNKDRSPNWSRGITKEEHDRLTAGKKRALTDPHPGLRKEHPQPDEHTSIIDRHITHPKDTP